MYGRFFLFLVLVGAGIPAEYSPRAHGETTPVEKNALTRSGLPERLHHPTKSVGKGHQYEPEYKVGTTDSIDYNALKTFIVDQKVKSVDALLERFSKDKGRFSRLLSDYVLVDRSRSAESADVSPETPRAILHADRLFLSFTDGASAPKGKGVHAGSQNILPIIEFSREKMAFQFRQIEFGKEGPRFIDNPTSCGECHGDPPRPNWFPYPFWPDAFGMDDSPIHYERAEQQRARRFVDSQGPNSRYRFLRVPLPDLSVVDEAKSANFRLSFHLQHLNWLAVWHELKSSPHFAQRKCAILAALIECKALDEYLPKQVAPQSVAQFEKAYSESNARFAAATAKAFGDEPDRKAIADQASRDTNYALAYAKVGWALQETNVNPIRWSISYLPGRSSSVNFRHIPGASNLGDRHSGMSLDEFLRRRLEEDLSTLRGAPNPMTCEWLREQSLRVNAQAIQEVPRSTRGGSHQ